MGSIFKKQCINLPSGLAVAQGKGIIFYLLNGMLLIAFMDS
jgi:hypothetical protein